MGLDIYVRWGRQDEDGEDIDMPEDAINNQMTGYRNAPECGYLRHNWASARLVREMAEEYEAPNPIRGMYPEWEGYNGETLNVTPDALAHLLELRNQALLWLRNKPYIKRNAKRELLATEQERQELDEGFDYFIQCIRNLVGFINFIELHKDEGNLRIYFG